MNCKQCGSPLTENDKFCKNCGAAVNAQPGGNSIQQPLNNPQYPQTEQNNVQQSVNVQPPQQTMNAQKYPQPSQNSANDNQNSWQNSYNQTPNFQQQRPNNNVIYIVIGVVIVAAIFAFGFMFNSMKDKEQTSSTGSEDSGIITTAQNSNKIKYKGFSFNIPDNLVYEVADNSLLIGNEDESWVIQLDLLKVDFAQLKTYKHKLQPQMQQSGFTSSEAIVQTLGGIEFITMELISGGTNFVGGIAKLNSDYSICLYAFSVDNEFNYKSLESIAPIIKSATYQTTTNNLTQNISIDTSIFAGITQ